MPMTRREFLAAAAVAPIGARWPGRNSDTTVTTPGRHALNLGDEWAYAWSVEQLLDRLESGLVARPSILGAITDASRNRGW